jgi:3-hydroxyanthranilate 3,4-dioxygenase
MLLKVVDTDSTSSTSTTPHFRDIPIHEGEMYLLPANTPHNPVRFADTVGIVLEQPRPEGAEDKMRWYCQECKAVVYEASFRCVDLGTQVKEKVVEFSESEELRRCEHCGARAEVVQTGVVYPG